MARSSGGGSRSGGSHSSGGSRSDSCSGGSSSRSVDTYDYDDRRRRRYSSNNHEYQQDGESYIVDIIGGFFVVLPFLIFLFFATKSTILTPQKPLNTYDQNSSMIIDEANVFTLREEQILKQKIHEFGEKTGITTQILTVNYDEWQDNGSFENYAMSMYYAQFDDENGWLLLYTEQDDTMGDWRWEGIQGDNTIDVLDVFINNFNNELHGWLVKEQTVNPANAFVKAFDVAINLFDNQTITFSPLFWPLFAMCFIIIVCTICAIYHEIKQRKTSEY